MKFNFYEQTSESGEESCLVSIWMDLVDLAVNPHYNTYESIAVRHELSRIGIMSSSYEFVDSWYVSLNSQKVTIKVFDPEAVVLLKLAFANQNYVD